MCNMLFIIYLRCFKMATFKKMLFCIIPWLPYFYAQNHGGTLLLNFSHITNSVFKYWTIFSIVSFILFVFLIFSWYNDTITNICWISPCPLKSARANETPSPLERERGKGSASSHLRFLFSYQMKISHLFGSNIGFRWYLEMPPLLWICNRKGFIVSYLSVKV